MQTLCKHLKVSTSAYYAWHRHVPSQRAIANQAMTEKIRQIHQVSDGIYGRIRLQAELEDMGLHINHKRIERLMRLAHIRGISRRGYVVTT